MSVQLTDNSLRVPEARYLRRDARGQIIETPDELFRRVARGIAEAESRFDGPQAVPRWEEAFYQLLSRLDFLPNSPTLICGVYRRDGFGAGFLHADL